MGMRKELRNEGRLNCASTVLELIRGLIASMRISRPGLVLETCLQRKPLFSSKLTPQGAGRRWGRLVSRVYLLDNI